MTTRVARLTVLLALAWCSGGPALTHAQSPQAAPFALEVIYAQPASVAGGLLPSSLRDPEGSASDQWAWDAFVLSVPRSISEIRWRGGYDPALLGSGGPVVVFVISIHASIPGGSQPDVTSAPLARYELSDNAGETPVGLVNGGPLYDYGFVLPVGLQLSAGKYWVQIEAYQAGAPDWALAAATGGDGYHFRRLASDGFSYQTALGDAAFAVLGPAIGPYVVALPLVFGS